MAVLNNPRHERFAEALASGKSASQAYAEAGYKKDRRNASRLTSNDDIRARVAELQSRAAERAVIDKQWVLDGLKELADRCMQRVAVLDRGRVVEYRFDAVGAVRALHLLGRELGMFVDRAEQDTNIRVISSVPLTEAEWEKRWAKEGPEHRAARSDGCMVLPAKTRNTGKRLSDPPGHALHGSGPSAQPDNRTRQRLSRQPSSPTAAATAPSSNELRQAALEKAIREETQCNGHGDKKETRKHFVFAREVSDRSNVVCEGLPLISAYRDRSLPVTAHAGINNSAARPTPICRNNLAA
jgi:hypothetical protein